MSYFNYLSARQYSLDSTNYGAPSNGTINTDGLGDIILNPSPSASVIVPQLTLNSDTSGVTNPTITTNSSGSITVTVPSTGSLNIPTTYLSNTLTVGPSTNGGTINSNGNLTVESGGGYTLQLSGDVVTLTGTSTTNITNDLTIEGTTLTIGNSSSNNYIETAGNLYINSGSTYTLQLDGDVVTLEGTSAINLTGPTIIGNSNSTSISNIAFGTVTFSDINVSGSGNNYWSSSYINLGFSPSNITLGITCNQSDNFAYIMSAAYSQASTQEGAVYSFVIYLYLPNGNNNVSANYTVGWTALYTA